MFGSSKDTKDNSSSSSQSRGSAAPSRGLNTVNEGTTLTGDLEAQSDIRIDGIINGDLKCKAKVIVGPKGMIKGTVACENAVIEGKFDGTLVVRDSLTIKDTASIVGEISAAKIGMNPGCSFEGTLTTKGPKSSSPKGGGDKVAQMKARENAKA